MIKFLLRFITLLLGVGLTSWYWASRGYVVPLDIAVPSSVIIGWLLAGAPWLQESSKVGMKPSRKLTKTPIVITLAVLMIVAVRAQDKPAAVIPPASVYPLNTASSGNWVRINQAEQAENERHAKAVSEFNQLRVVMLQAAGIPEDAWPGCVIGAGGLVTCSKPEAKVESKKP